MNASAIGPWNTAVRQNDRMDCISCTAGIMWKSQRGHVCDFCDTVITDGQYLLHCVERMRERMEANSGPPTYRIVSGDEYIDNWSDEPPTTTDPFYRGLYRPSKRRGF